MDNIQEEIVDEYPIRDETEFTLTVVENDDNVSEAESDIGEKEFTKLSIHNEKFVLNLNKLFLVLIS